METKLDLALRNFSANPSPHKFKRETIFNNALKGVAKGAAIGGEVLAGGLLGKYFLNAGKVNFSPAEISVALGVPIAASAGYRAAKSAKEFNKAQRYINTFNGVQNLAGDQILIDVLPDVNNDIFLKPKKINRYLPKEENDKFKARLEEVEKNYPLNKYKRGTWDYEMNNSIRQSELDSIKDDKAVALLNYAKLSNTKKKLKFPDEYYYISE